MKTTFVNLLVTLLVSLGVTTWTLDYALVPSPAQATHFLFLAAGTCPAGWVQDTTFDGDYLRITVAAHNNVGTTGGSATLTATGTVSAPIFTGNSVASSAVSAGTPAGTNSSVSFTPTGTNGTGTVTATGTIAWPAGVPTSGVLTFTGTPFSSVINHTHSLVSTSFTPRLQGGTTASTTGTHLMASAATGGSLRNSAETTVAATPATDNPAGGVSSITPAGTINTPTIAWPAGVPTFSGSSAITSAQAFTGDVGTVPAESFTGTALGTHTHTTTATGTNAAPTFTGDAVTNTPSYVNLILCKPAGSTPVEVPGVTHPSRSTPPPAKREPRFTPERW